MSLVLANVVNGADIRVIQSGGGLRFALEAGQSLRIPGYFIGKEFQRNEAAQPGVFCLVDHAHAAAAELLDHPVVRDGLAEQWKSLQSVSQHVRPGAAWKSKAAAGSGGLPAQSHPRRTASYGSGRGPLHWSSSW